MKLVFKNHIMMKKNFWSPSRVESLIVLAERVIALINKLYRFVDFFVGKEACSLPF